MSKVYRREQAIQLRKSIERGDDPECIRALVQSGADPNTCFYLEDGDIDEAPDTTPFRYSLESGQMRSCLIMLQHGANPDNIYYDEDETWDALGMAIYWGWEEIVENIISKTHKKPGRLDFESNWMGHVKSIGNVKPIGNDKPIGNVKPFKKMPESTQTGRNKWCGTPLLMACRGRNIRMVNCLLQHGADPNLVGGKILQVQHTGALMPKMKQEFRPHHETVPLLLATSLNEPDIVRLIVNANVDPNMRKSALLLAREKKYQLCWDILNSSKEKMKFIF